MRRALHPSLPLRGFFAIARHVQTSVDHGNGLRLRMLGTLHSLGRVRGSLKLPQQWAISLNMYHDDDFQRTPT